MPTKDTLLDLIRVIIQILNDILIELRKINNRAERSRRDSIPNKTETKSG